MPLITLAITIFLLMVYYVLDKIPFKSDKLIFTVYYVEDYLITLSVQLGLLSMLEVIVTETTPYSIYRWWGSLPFHSWLILIYLLYSAHNTYKKAKAHKAYSFISGIRRKAKAPLQRLNFLLIDAKYRREICEKKLSLLKSFSPLPVALLVLNNFGEITFENFNLQLWVYSNILNIFLISFLCIYAYHIIMTFLLLKKSITQISTIEQEIHLCNNPDTFIDK